jgi:isoquinoline 1-oxidoreductase beta subunit
MAITRRFFMLTGATIGGGLLLGVGALGAHLQTHNRVAVQRNGNEDTDAAQINLWIRITADNQIILVNPHSDMGQGTATGLMQIVADELDADWNQMRSEIAPPDSAYSNGKVIEGFVREMMQPPTWANTLLENGFYRVGDLMNMQMTGGSTAVRYTGWEAMRKAAAATRQMLLAAAAQQLNVDVSTLSTENGTVNHSASGKSVSYGDLASTAATMDSPKEVALKTPEQYKYIGQSMPREDIPDKVMATTEYGIDATAPDMQYAAVVTSGVFGAQVSSIKNTSAITSLRGVSDVLTVPDGVAVVADNPWRAEQAVRQVEFDVEPHANSTLSTESELARQRAALTNNATEGLSLGEPDSIDATINADYSVPYLAHATLEPMNATVWMQDGELHVVAGVQNPLGARARVAKEAGMKLDQVKFHARAMGGGFGRRVAFSQNSAEPLNWLVQAVRIALDTGKSVKTTWSRETDTRSDVYRPMVTAQFAGELADDGKPLLWRSTSYGKEMNIHAAAPMYQIPNVKVSTVNESFPVPTGFWRSVEHTQHGFFVESFIDELATAAGIDPLQYRINLLPEDSAAVAVLNKVADMSGWSTTANNNERALGVAMVHSFGSTVAQVAQISKSGSGLKVDRVWCAADCGTAVNPQAVEAQVQGAVIYGLTAALYGKCDLQNGGVVQSNFHDYRMVNLQEAPSIEVALVDTGSAIGGVGEIGVPPIAPAVSNALAALDGNRRRDLPLG